LKIKKSDFQKTILDINPHFFGIARVFYGILNKDQAGIFPKLKFSNEKGFYLAGGTALALHLRHR